MDKRTVKSGLEAILFVWGSPVDPGACAGVFGVSVSQIVDCLEELAGEYESRGSGLMIRRIDGSYQICTRPECEEAVRKFCTPVKNKKLSGAALEVLAIIAYRQPVSRVEIDEIRGVKSERAVESLLKRGLVEERGRGTGLGRPILYGTTQLFLEKFGIESLKELPAIEDVVKDWKDDGQDSQQISMNVSKCLSEGEE